MPGCCLLPAGGEKSVNMHTANLSTVCKSTYPTLNFRKSRNKFLNCNNSVTQKVAILTFHAVLSLCNPDWTSTWWVGVNRNVLSYYSQQTIQFIKSPNHQPRYHLQNATSSPVITRHEEKKSRPALYFFIPPRAYAHILTSHTCIYNNNVYLTAPSIPLRPPLRRQSTCPYRRSTRSDGRRGSKNGRHGRKDRHANRTPRDGPPNTHHLQPTTSSPPHQT